MQAESVFLSYAREDQQKARRLSSDLQRAGVLVWSDEKLKPGENFPFAIDTAINQCRFFLPLISTHFIEPGYATRELNKALARMEEFGPNHTFIIPVRLDESQPVQRVLQELHRVDLFPGENNWLAGVEAIVQSLNASRAPELFKRVVTGLHPLGRVSVPRDAERTFQPHPWHRDVVGVRAQFQAVRLQIEALLRRLHALLTRGQDAPTKEVVSGLAALGIYDDDTAAALHLLIEVGDFVMLGGILDNNIMSEFLGNEELLRLLYSLQFVLETEQSRRKEAALRSDSGSYLGSLLEMAGRDIHGRVQTTRLRTAINESWNEVVADPHGQPLRFWAAPAENTPADAHRREDGAVASVLATIGGGYIAIPTNAAGQPLFSLVAAVDATGEVVADTDPPVPASPGDSETQPSSPSSPPMSGRR